MQASDRGYPQTREAVSGCRKASTLRHSPTAFSCPTVCNVRRTMRVPLTIWGGRRLEQGA
jgi:hypothetical protein